VIVFPVTAYLMLSAYQQKRESLVELQQRSMIRNRETMDRATSSGTVGDLMNVTPSMGRLVRLAIGLGCGVAMVEVVVNNVYPLLSRAPYAITKTTDWGEGYFLTADPPQWLRYANALFDVSAFALEGIALSAGFLFLFYFLELASRLRDLRRDPSLIIIPDVIEPDRRRGFNVFDRPIQLMLYSSLGMFVMCYLSRIMKLYFDDGQARTPWAFVLNDLGQAPKLSFDESRESLMYWLAPGATSTLMSVIVASVGFILVLFVTITISDLLRGTAKQSRDDLARWIASGRQLPDVPPNTDVAKALNSMELWPVAYPSVRDFWALVVVTCVATVSYRLVLVVVVIGFLAAFNKVRRLFGEHKPTSQPT
jgi:hypothetical protein